MSMSKNEYFSFAESFFGNCVEISRKKNADYTGKDDNPFGNFQSVEVLGISTEHGLLTRIMDKVKRVASFVENGQLLVKDESVTDTLQDLANYSCLFAGYLKSKQQQIEATPSQIISTTINKYENGNQENKPQEDINVG